MDLLRRLGFAGIVGALALAGCGKSQEAKLVEQLSNECWGLHAAGATLNDAGNDFAYANYISGGGAPECVLMQPLSSSDPCGQDSATTITVCHINFSFYPSDPSLCSTTTGGCWLGCEVRVTQTDFQANGVDAKVCNSLWFSGQPAPPFQ